MVTPRPLYFAHDRRHSGFDVWHNRMGQITTVKTQVKCRLAAPVWSGPTWQAQVPGPPWLPLATAMTDAGSGQSPGHPASYRWTLLACDTSDRLISQCRRSVVVHQRYITAMISP